MSSIYDNRPVVQAPRITSYRYALKLTPQQIQKLTRDELLALCMEQYFLLWLIISIIRNPLAAIATRIIAVDLIISHVEKTVKGNIKQITDRSPVYISGDKGTAKRLGIHANTISKSFNNLAKYQMIKRDYRFDEATQREHLDITITPLQLDQPEKLQDKTLRKMAEAGKKQSTPQGKASLPDTLNCPSCGSGDIQIICRECGTISTPEEMAEAPDKTDTDTLIENVIESVLLNKFYVVDTINAPLVGVDIQRVDTDEQTQVSDIAQITEDIAAAPQEERVMPRQDENEVIMTWLAKRIGHGKLIYATGSSEYSKKYYNKPPDYQPNYRAYLAGDKRHILGSYLSREDGTTYVLAFDFDTQEEALHDNHEVLLQTLVKAGAAPVYWMRQNKRGHLELYFDRPVTPEIAQSWCISVCPELATVAECYPASDKQNQPISWPLFQRKGDTVTPCQAKAMFPQSTQLYTTLATDTRGIAALVVQAVTPAALVEAYAQQLQPAGLSERDPGQTQPTPAETPPIKPQTNADLAKVVIAEFNATTTWDEVVALCGGFTREKKFNAVWRGERTPSVALDANGEFACDYGRTGDYPKKLDRYEVWCYAQGGREFKRFDLAKRIEAYRKRQMDTPPALLPPQPAPQRGEAPPPSARPAPIILPTPEETGEDIVARLRSETTVDTPLGRGRLWRVWPTEIGVVLDSDPGRVKFFKTLEDMRRVIAIRDAEDRLL